MTDDIRPAAAMPAPGRPAPREVSLRAVPAQASADMQARPVDPLQKLVGRPLNR